MKKILTVIIPTYNMEKYLHKCIQSLILNDSALMKNLEVIVVNDGSKDKSLEIANSYSKRYPDIIKVINKQNGNYGSCVNQGIAAATGKYIKVLDADDSFDKDGLYGLLKAMLSNDADIFISDYVLVSEEGKIIEERTFNLNRGEVIGIDVAVPHILNSQMHAVAFKTQILKNINYHQTEGISYTDQEWIFYPLSSVRSLYYLPNIVYKYLVGRSGQTVEHITFHKKVGDRICIFKQMVSWYIDNFSQIHNSVIEPYIRKKLYSIYHSVYLSCLIVNRDKETAKDLDDFMLSKSVELYKMAEDFSLHKYWRYKFIRNWRKNKYLPPLIISNVYNTIKKFSSR